MAGIGQWSAAAGAAFAGKYRWLSLAAVTAPAAYAALSQHVAALPKLPVWISFVLTVVVVCVVFLARLVRLEVRLSPKVKVARASISPAQMGPAFVGPDARLVAAEYVHVELETLGQTNVSNCSLYLLRIRRKRSDGASHTIEFSPPIQLITASKHQVSATCFHGVPLHFDLVTARSDDRRLRFAPKTPGTPNTLKPEFFQEHGVYEFDLRAASDAPPSVDATVAIEWTGSWDGMKPVIVGK